MNANKRLDRLNKEDFIWLVYLFIIFEAFYANYLERQYIKNGCLISYQKEKQIDLQIAIIVFIIYLYFFYLALEDYWLVINKPDNKGYQNTTWQLVAAFLFLLGGIITIYLASKTNEIDEIGII